METTSTSLTPDQLQQIHTAIQRIAPNFQGILTCMPEGITLTEARGKVTADVRRMMQAGPECEEREWDLWGERVIDREYPILVVHLTGNYKEAAAYEDHKKWHAIQHLLEQDATSAVVLDCSAITSYSGSELGFTLQQLIRLIKQESAARGNQDAPVLCGVAACPTLAAVIQTSRWDRCVRICSSREEALAAAVEHAPSRADGAVVPAER